MYLQHFGLSVNPFGMSPRLDFLYKSAAFEESMAHLVYGLDNSEAIVLITGPIGSGKTMSLQSFLANLSSRYQTALVTNTQVTTVELLKLILEDLDVEIGVGWDKSDLLIAFKQFLIRSGRVGEKVVVVIDEAQNLATDVLEEVRLLTNLGQGLEQPVQLILAGQPELQAMVNRPELAQLRQRIRVHYEVETLGFDEMVGYLNHRMKVAGCAREVFDRGALRKLFEVSGGVPRLVNTHAGDALLSAYVAQRSEVTAQDVVEGVRNEPVPRGPGIGESAPTAPVDPPTPAPVVAPSTPAEPVLPDPPVGDDASASDEVVDLEDLLQSVVAHEPPRPVADTAPDQEKERDLDAPDPVRESPPEPKPASGGRPVYARHRPSGNSSFRFAFVILAIIVVVVWFVFARGESPRRVAGSTISMDMDSVAAVLDQSTVEDGEPADRIVAEKPEPIARDPRSRESVEGVITEESPVETVVSSTKGFFVHVASFRDSTRAGVLLDGFTQRSLPGFIEKRRVGNETWTGVYVGPWPTRTEARSAARELLEAGTIDYYQVIESPGGDSMTDLP